MIAIVLKVVLAVVALTLAAWLEVTGDTMLNIAVRRQHLPAALGGLGLLCLYGLAVNAYNAILRFVGKPSDPESWDFPKLLGVYICFFAAMNLCLAYRQPNAVVSPYLKAGTLIIVIGGAVIQFGSTVGNR